MPWERRFAHQIGRDRRGRGRGGQEEGGERERCSLKSVREPNIRVKATVTAAEAQPSLNAAHIESKNRYSLRVLTYVRQTVSDKERQRANGQSSRVIPSEEVNPSPPGFKLCTLLAHIRQTQRTLIRGPGAVGVARCSQTPETVSEEREWLPP